MKSLLKQLNHLKVFSIASALSVYILMILGAYVSSVGAGLACGTDWPLCEGRIFPRADPLVIAEYVHRVFSLVVGFFVLGTAIIASKSFSSNRGVAIAAYAAAILLVVQVLWGALVVKSGIDPILRTIHLSLATAVFGSTTITAALAYHLK